MRARSTQLNKRQQQQQQKASSPRMEPLNSSMQMGLLVLPLGPERVSSLDGHTTLDLGFALLSSARRSNVLWGSEKVIVVVVVVSMRLCW